MAKKQQQRNRKHGFLLGAFTATLTGLLVTGSIFSALMLWIVVLFVYAIAVAIHSYFRNNK